MVLSVEASNWGLLVPIDLAPVRKAATESLAALGFLVVAEASPAPEGALSLLLEARTMKTAQGVFIYELLGRLSLLRDRNFEDNEPGKPQRVWLVGRVLGQKEEAGLEDGMANTALRLMGDLTAPRLPRKEQVLEDWARVQVLTKALEPKGFTPPQVVGFDFSQIKVKRQPPAPLYPLRAKAHRIQGLVVVDIIINPEGNPVYAEALEGPPELLLTALNYAFQWEFEPARLNGVPLFAHFQLTMPFRLRQKAAL